MTLTALDDFTLLTTTVDEICFGSSQDVLSRYPSANHPAVEELAQTALVVARDAYEEDAHAVATVHSALDSIYQLHFSKPPGNEVACDRIGLLSGVQRTLEDYVIGNEDNGIQISDAPSGDDPDLFVRDLKLLVRGHPANRHDFYIDFLPHHATVLDIRFYLAQETALDPRFDDFIAAMQIGCDPQPKLELATNYWDEMGNGNTGRIHTKMFDQAMQEVGATKSYVESNRMTETLACGNLSAALALNRRYYYRSIGSFAVTEFLFPRRCAQLLLAWARNGLPAASGEYHREHIGVDARHASGFFRNVIKPELEKDPATARDIYWGAIARMNSSLRYLNELSSRIGEDAYPK